MKISTKGRYALRMMIELATKAEGQYTSLKDISQSQNISVKYLEQITGMLSKSGMIKSARGSNGGHMLSKRPEQYTVGEILRVTEGSLSPVACLDDKSNLCQRSGSCVTLEFWEGLEKVINDYVDGITLDDLLQKYKTQGTLEYTI